MAVTREDYLQNYEERYPIIAFSVSRDDVLPASPKLSVLSVSAINSTTVRVTFNLPVDDNVALRAPANYSFSPTLTVQSVTPQAISNPTYVDLTVSEMLQGQAYTPTVHTIALSED